MGVWSRMVHILVVAVLAVGASVACQGTTVLIQTPSPPAVTQSRGTETDTVAQKDPVLVTKESVVPEAPVAPVPTLTPAPTSVPPEANETIIVTAPTQNATPAASGEEQMVALAIADLVGWIGAAEGDVAVLYVDEVEWPDAGLGCPQSGMLYAQVSTPGYRIVLEVEGQAYEYHTGQDQTVILCAAPESRLDASAGDELPFFVEMLEAPLSPEASARMPPKDGMPTGAFAFNQVDRSLLVPDSVQILPTTEVLVGVMSASVPNRPYVASELIQIPSSQPAPVAVVAIAADSGELTLTYGGQTFELAPGESRSFKQVGEGELAPIVITTLTNHGQLASVGLLPADPSGP